MFIYVKFPEWFEFVGTESSCFNQVGNAIPPLFAFHLAGMVRNYLRSRNAYHQVR
jgi:DNA (cytosine-5)-methyltransferase 1